MWSSSAGSELFTHAFDMQLLWFLPSIAYGAMLAVTSGNYLLLVSTLLSAGAMLVVRWRMSVQPKLSADTKLHVLENRIWLDDYRLPRGSAFWSKEQFDFVFDRLSNQGGEILQHCRDFIARNFNFKRSRLSAVLGFNSDGQFVASLVDDGPHGIIVGATGSGKTELLRNFVRGVIESSPRAAFVLIDFKGGEGLAEFAQQSINFVTDHDVEECNRVLAWLTQQLSERSRSKGFDELVIVVDELAHLLSEVRGAEQALASIAARGRSAKMHLLLTNQNLVGVPRSLLSNLKLRCLVGQPDPVDAALLGQPAKAQAAPEVGYRITAGQLVGHGSAARAFWFTATKPVPSPAQPQAVSEPEPLRRWSTDPGEYSSQERAMRQHGRRRANRGSLPHARKARLRW